MRGLIIGMAAMAAMGQPGTPAKGRAKDVFFDTSSTVVVYVPKSRPRVEAGRRSRPATAPGVERKPVVLPASIGIRYHVELLGEGGEALPVAASRAFATGERIRLHVTSNVGGRLTVLQSVNGAAPEQLFPGRGTRVEDSVVKAMAPVVIPARGFRFQPPAGEIVLTVRVDPELRPAAPAARPVAVAAAPVESAPVAAGGPAVDPSLFAEIADVPAIADTVRQQNEGRKSLVLEEDGPDTTVVQPVSDEVKPLIATIVLRQVK